MNILFDLGHPAHVHLFKNFIYYLKNKGHEVTVVSRAKDITNELLEYYKIKYLCLSNPHKSLPGKLFELLSRDLKILNLHRKHHYSLAFGTSISIAHLSALSKVQSFRFSDNDDDFIPLDAFISFPFFTKIISPECLRYTRWKEKRELHNSYHELAYLHPDNFTPNKNILKKYGLTEKKYIIARFCAYDAHHDTNLRGINQSLWKEIRQCLKSKGYQIIESIENSSNAQIKPYDIHDVLAFSKMIISDSGTMSSEAAALGVPAVCISNFLGKLSTIEEQRNKFQLIVGIQPQEQQKIIDKIESLVKQDDLNDIWKEKQKKMLEQKTDLSKWMIDYFNNNLCKEKRSVKNI